MGIYSLRVEGLQTGSSAGAYKTVLNLKMANTAGHRGRLRKVVVSGGVDTPQDIQVGIKVDISDNTGDGTSASSPPSVGTIQSHDGLQRASAVDAIGWNFSAEPTTYAGQPNGGSFNTRGDLVLDWAPGEGPIWGKNQALGILGAPGVATAAKLVALIEWEE